uniref:Alpha-amylase/branching enzyme C-terminal all beta domain-containing protein n=1 Tax=Timema cristinae TaxID=61476 RepID=A0A7R9CB41_TIMCR|nr:unnamed protein product [Timema cristinae]
MKPKWKAYVSWKHEDDKVIVFERADLVFIFNFHPTKSFTNYRIGVEIPGTYKVCLNSDDEQFGGFKRVDNNVPHYTYPEHFANRQNSLMCFVPKEGCRGRNKMTERERSRAENGPNGEQNFVCYSVMGDKILNQISRVNEQLQHKYMTVDRAVSHEYSKNFPNRTHQSMPHHAPQSMGINPAYRDGWGEETGPLQVC